MHDQRTRDHRQQPQAARECAAGHAASSQPTRVPAGTNRTAPEVDHKCVQVRVESNIGTSSKTARHCFERRKSQQMTPALEPLHNIHYAYFRRAVTRKTGRRLWIIPDEMSISRLTKPRAPHPPGCGRNGPLVMNLMAAGPPLPVGIQSRETDRHPPQSLGGGSQHVAEIVDAQIDAAQSHQQDQEERHKNHQNAPSPRRRLGGQKGHGTGSRHA